MEQYANDLENAPSVIKELAEAQLRYNEAVERTNDNIDD